MPYFSTTNPLFSLSRQAAERRRPNVFARVLLLLFFTTVSSGHLSSAKAQGTGSLSVTTTPVRAAIYVDNVFKGTSFWSGNLDPGPHMVSFGDVEGYIAPAPQIVNITAGQTSYAIGAYRKLLPAGQREWSWGAPAGKSVLKIQRSFSIITGKALFICSTLFQYHGTSKA